jgi:hypothetical protein
MAAKPACQPLNVFKTSYAWRLIKGRVLNRRTDFTRYDCWTKHTGMMSSYLLLIYDTLRFTQMKSWNVKYLDWSVHWLVGVSAKD